MQSSTPQALLPGARPEPSDPALFLPLSRGNLLEMLPIARAVRQAGLLQPIFCLCSKVTNEQDLIREFDAVRTDGSSLPMPKGERLQRESYENPKSSRSSWKESAFRLFPPLLTWFLLLRAEKKRAKKLLKAFPNARLILVAGDRCIGIETALISEAKRRNIPSLIVPFAMSFPEAAAEPRLRSDKSGGQYAADTLLKKLLMRMFPSWVLTYKGTPLFFQPPYEACAAWLLGIMPQKPWIIGGGEAVKMAVESEALRKQLLQQGMKAEKMVVTGKPSIDTTAKKLHTVRGSQARDRLGIPHQEKIILCSVPNFAEHDLLPWKIHKKEMQFLFKTLKAADARVLLSLHPRSNRTWYQPLADESGAEIMEERIYDLLPTCDLLVTSYSSTVAIAIGMQKPSIVIDFYGFNYPVYDGAPGTTVIKEKTALLPLLQLLLKDDHEYYRRLQQLQKYGEEWALLDGKSTNRITTLIQELIA
jgi:hypothetical protein